MIKKNKIKSNGERLRLSIFRSNLYIYAQVIDDETGNTVVSASSMKLKTGQNIDAAKEVGKTIATLSLEKNIKKVIFDRGRFQYKGRVKALAEAAREGGLEF